MKKIKKVGVLVFIIMLLSSCSLNLKTCKVTFVLSDGEMLEENYDDIAYVNYGGTLYLPNLSKIGYKFEGWFTGNTISDGQRFSTSYITNDLVLYPRWSLIEYKIEYQTDGGINYGNPTSYNIESDDIVLNSCYKDGFNFINWTCENQVITKIEKGSYGNVLLKANYDYRKYKINYFIDGECLNNNPVCYTLKDLPIQLEDIEMDNYIFEGWYGDINYSKKINLINYEMMGDINLYAKFTKKDEYYGITPVVSIENRTIKYGLYPQTNVNDEKLISNLNSLVSLKNNWYLYDNDYYYKKLANPLKDNYRFNNGDKIIKNDYYWFKCEPVVWDILKEENNKYTLISNKILDANIFDDESCYYYKSKIRNRLNEDFYNSCFKFNNEFIVSNTINVEKDANNNVDVTDNVFLISENDYKDYNFDLDISLNFKKGASCTTDYSRILGASCVLNESTKYNGYYWMRSSYKSEFSEYVSAFGGISYKNCYDMASVRPCVTIEIN